MGCGSVTSKICLNVIGFIFWGAAAALIYLGAWVYHTYNHFNELTTANLTLIPAGIVIIVGVFLFLLGCISCIAACKESKCLLAVFFSVLLVILTAEICAGVLGYIFRDTVKTSVHDGLDKAINKYSMNETTTKHQVDYLQKELKCCGSNNASDWVRAKVWNSSHVPSSCCNLDKVPKHNITQCNTIYGESNTDIYMQGCVDKLEKKFEANLVYIAGVAVAFAVIQLLGMICSCVLMCRSQEVRYEMLGGPNSGLRV